MLVKLEIEINAEIFKPFHDALTDFGTVLADAAGEELRDLAYSIAGEPEKISFGNRIVGIIEARDGSIIDVVRQYKPVE